MVFVGRVERYKGLEQLMAALSLPSCPSGLSVVIAGECRDRQLAESLAQQAASNSAAIELRFERLSDKEVASLLDTADAAVFPFRSVTTSGSVLLALSAGCPVVIPDLPAFAGVPSACAWRYTGGSEALAQALAEVASTSPARRTEMAAAALAYADLFSWTASSARDERAIRADRVRRAALRRPAARASHPRCAGRRERRMSDGQGEPGREQRAGSIGKSIVSGLSWNSLGQITSVAVAIVLTPFLVLRLGLDRYGIFAVVSSVIGVLSNLDGGFGASTLRFFSVHVGGGERGAESRLLVTASLILAVGAGALGAVVGVLAPSIVVRFHAPHQLYGQAALILRILVPVVVVSMWSDLLQALLAAHNRWRTPRPHHHRRANLLRGPCLLTRRCRIRDDRPRLCPRCRPVRRQRRPRCSPPCGSWICRAVA